MSKPQKRKDSTENARSSKSIAQVAMMQAWSSPFPPPQILERYKDIDPGFPERIIKMAEKEGDHRRAMQKMAMEKTFSLMARGQIFALFVATLGLGVAGFSIWLNHPTAGAIIGGTSLVALVTAFLKGPRKQSALPTKESSSSGSDSNMNNS